MGQAGLPRWLVDPADLVPDLRDHHRGAVILADDYVQAIVEGVAMGRLPAVGHGRRREQWKQQQESTQAQHAGVLFYSAVIVRPCTQTGVPPAAGSYRRWRKWGRITQPSIWRSIRRRTQIVTLHVWFQRQTAKPRCQDLRQARKERAVRLGPPPGRASARRAAGRCTGAAHRRPEYR